MRTPQDPGCQPVLEKFGPQDLYEVVDSVFGPSIALHPWHLEALKRLLGGGFKYCKLDVCLFTLQACPEAWLACSPYWSSTEVAASHADG